ncbi:hypothetical protein GCM10009558_059610 [Virgisporangium aurantiacum]
MDTRAPFGPSGSPAWPGLLTLAPTLAHDAALYGPPPADRLAAVRQPTLVITGETTGFFADAAAAVADLLPDATVRTFDGAGHVPPPDLIGPALRDFLGPAVLRPPGPMRRPGSGT